MLDWITGFLGSSLIAGAAYGKKSLSGTGMIAAVVLGTIMYGLGSPAWYGTLLCFFVTSSLLSSYKKKMKTKVESGYEKSGRRDAGQVFANGGTGLVLCILNSIWPSPDWFILFIGAMATVNADTWATEIGGLSRSVPRSVITWKKVLPGQSGGVSVLGTFAAALGGLVIGVTAWVLLDFSVGSTGNISGEMNGLKWALIGSAAGLIGAMADSVLGALYQKMYRCPVCGREVERSEHCGTKTIRSRGWGLMSNDMVNAASSIVGAFAAWLFF